MSICILNVLCHGGSVKHPSLGFGSGHDLRWSLASGSALSVESACPSLSLCSSPALPPIKSFKKKRSGAQEIGNLWGILTSLKGRM